MIPLNIDFKSSTIEKFIDVVAAAIGNLSAPYLLRKMAEARGQEMFKIAESIDKTVQIIGDNYEVKYEAENFQITPTKKDELVINPRLQRIESRLNVIEEQRQKNIDKITIYGLLEAARISETSNEKIDRDWLNQFINVSQDVSSDQMQEVWGKILAREISNPGSFSLRSLEVLRTISRQEAEIFRKMVQFVFCVDNYRYIFHDHTIYNGTGDGWNDYVLMREIGLFTPGIFGVNFRSSPNCNLVFKHGHLSFKIIASKDTDFHLNGYPLSVVGRELVKLIQITPDSDYFDRVKAEVSEKDGLECVMLTDL
ncbi:DUF2806 domain-containing protein [Chlorobium sp. BLA1]|uniref:DUF2806 domain-containing protein n=1 Tax=Candidatus Chlorobium masyuteum TaxID=2716876 RepID=UPI00141FAF9B|nr:DUF2806 domain-containing protein [Candidatus Chlorobium masyuteum]NHQ59832.1 DUF2806 domain-containing protein [Candidatus Chlorobium masyuteum]